MVRQSRSGARGEHRFRLLIARGRVEAKADETGVAAVRTGWTDTRVFFWRSQAEQEAAWTGRWRSLSRLAVSRCHNSCEPRRTGSFGSSGGGPGHSQAFPSGETVHRLS